MLEPDAEDCVPDDLEDRLVIAALRWKASFVVADGFHEFQLSSSVSIALLVSFSKLGGEVSETAGIVCWLPEVAGASSTGCADDAGVFPQASHSP